MIVGIAWLKHAQLNHKRGASVFGIVIVGVMFIVYDELSFDRFTWPRLQRAILADAGAQQVCRGAPSGVATPSYFSRRHAEGLNEADRSGIWHVSTKLRCPSGDAPIAARLVWREKRWVVAELRPR